MPEPSGSHAKPLIMTASSVMGRGCAALSGHSKDIRAKNLAALIGDLRVVWRPPGIGIGVLGGQACDHLQARCRRSRRPPVRPGGSQSGRRPDACRHDSDQRSRGCESGARRAAERGYLPDTSVSFCRGGRVIDQRTGIGRPARGLVV